MADDGTISEMRRLLSDERITDLVRQAIKASPVIDGMRQNIAEMKGNVSEMREKIARIDRM